MIGSVDSTPSVAPLIGLTSSTIQPAGTSLLTTHPTSSKVSGASFRYSILTCAVGRPVNASDNSAPVILGASLFCRFTNSSLASAASFSSAAARSFDFPNSRLAVSAAEDAEAERLSASMASVCASSSFEFDLRTNSLWQVLARALNRTSPRTPLATNISANTDPHRSQKHSYGRWSIARKTSISSPTTTKPPQYREVFSLNETAPSSASSVAFISLFSRRHATRQTGDFGPF